MAKKITQQIEEEALKIINRHPEGIRYKDIEIELLGINPEFNTGTIGVVVPGLRKKHGKTIDKPDWGLYAPIADELLTSSEDMTQNQTNRVPNRESDFYNVFSEFLKDDLRDCQRTAPLGNCGLGGKWNTPDIVGTNKSPRGTLVDYPLEIISAELKSEINQTAALTGFAQAVAYKLFSTKSYLVLPKKAMTSKQGLRRRLIALCMMERIGLIGFDHENPDNPDWDVLLRALPVKPDTRYAEEFAIYLKNHSNAKISKLVE